MARFTSNNTMLANHGYGVVNPGATSTTELKQYETALKILKENPIDYKDASSLFERQVGYTFQVPLQTLLMSWEHEEFSQYSVKPGNVLKLLVGADGLLTGNKLSRHIEAAYPEANVREDGSIIDLFNVIIGGGRHRLGAIIFILVFSQMVLRGIDPLTLITNPDGLADTAMDIMEEDAFLEVMIPVQPVAYSLQYIARSNQSRRMDASENNFIALQSQGVGINLVDIAKAVVNKQVSPTKGWSAMFALLADSKDVGLTTLAGSQLGGKVFNFLKAQKFPFPTKAENLVTIIQAAWERVPLEVELQLKNGVTNMARQGVPAITSNLGGWIKMNARSLYSPDSEVPANVKAKSTKGKKTGETKPKTKLSKKQQAELAASTEPVALLDDAELTAAG